MQVCRVQFKKIGKKYFFDPRQIEVKPNDLVVVETIRGLEMGTVVGPLMECPEAIKKEIKPIIRLANQRDLDNHDKYQALEAETFNKSLVLIKKNNLEMKLLACEYTLDGQKLTIYFEAEGRVDFRNLVKDLAEEFRTRIDLRQVGSRDGAKLIGGLGPCGLIVCCNTFIEEFDNVSIKMAKNQSLSLNPQKISGTCGKLLCCIKYENDTYVYMKKNMPDVNDIVVTEEGEGKVLSIDVLKQTVRIKLFNEDKFLVVELDKIKQIKSKKGNKNDTNEANDLKGLE